MIEVALTGETAEHPATTAFQIHCAPLMLFVPFPFVVAILLTVLFWGVARQDDEAPLNTPLLALILVGALLSFLTGLRWGYDVEAVGYVAPVLAATVPPLAYLGVSRLVGNSALPTAVRLRLHALPAVGIVLLMATWRSAIDIALVLVFVGYAVAILLFMRRGADALRLAPFESADPAYRAILFSAFALLFSATVDVFVFLDMAWANGTYAVTVITGSNLVALGILSIAAAHASRSHAPAESAHTEQTADPTEAGSDHRDEEDTGDIRDAATFGAVQALMESQHIYRDVDLNLNRLARKLGIPARQVSAAINRATGKNVSQYVNEHRIQEACDLLARTERPVTEIMFEVGFQTKSNFNREFRRVTDMSPVEWRDRRGPAS